MKKIFIVIFLFSSLSCFSQTFEQVHIISGNLLKSNNLFMKDLGPFFIPTGANAIELFNTDFESIGYLFWDAQYPLKNIKLIGTLQGGIDTSISEGDYAYFIGLSQTLFNDDEQFEYMTFKDGKWLVRQARTIKPDNSVEAEEKTLKEILPPEGYTFNGSNPYIYILNDKTYIAFGCKEYLNNKRICVYYRINKEKASSIEKNFILEKTSTQRKIYDITGKKLSRPTKGVNIIKDGDEPARKVVFK